MGFNSDCMSTRLICLGIGIIQGELFHQVNDWYSHGSLCSIT